MHSRFFKLIKDIIHNLMHTFLCGTHVGQTLLIDEKGASTGGHMLPAGLYRRPPN